MVCEMGQELYPVLDIPVLQLKPASRTTTSRWRYKSYGDGIAGIVIRLPPIFPMPLLPIVPVIPDYLYPVKGCSRYCPLNWMLVIFT
jgi:hypothetical protein